MWISGTGRGQKWKYQMWSGWQSGNDRQTICLSLISHTNSHLLTTPINCITIITVICSPFTRSRVHWTILIPYHNSPPYGMQKTLVNHLCSIHSRVTLSILSTTSSLGHLYCHSLTTYLFISYYCRCPPITSHNSAFLIMLFLLAPTHSCFPAAIMFLFSSYINGVKVCHQLFSTLYSCTFAFSSTHF